MISAGLNVITEAISAAAAEAAMLMYVHRNILLNLVQNRPARVATGPLSRNVVTGIQLLDGCLFYRAMLCITRAML